MDFLIQERREDIDRIAISQMINLNHIIGETAYIKEVEELLIQYDEIISKGLHDIRNCIMVEHAIHLITKKSIQCKYRSKTPTENDWIDEQVKIMLENGVIEEANSSYSSNVIVVKKKDREGKGIDRLCINLVPLNKVTIPDKYPLPNINEMLTNFYGATIFTILDLAAAYWQIMLRDKNKAKTAFLTRNGQYQF